MSVIYGGLDLTVDPYTLSPDSDFGVGEKETGVVSHILTDGDSVSGLRTANREITLNVAITATSRAAFAAAEAALALQADQAANTLTAQFGDATAADSLPVVADTFRATLTPTYNAFEDRSFYREYVLSIPALPFFRSTDPTTLGASLFSTLTLDSFDTAPTLVVTSGTGGAVSTDSVHKTQGTASTTVSGIRNAVTGYGPVVFTLSRTFTATDYSAYGSVTFDVAEKPSSTYYGLQPSTFTITFTDSSSRTAAYTGPRLFLTPNGQYGVFITTSIDFAGGTVSSGFDWVHVTKWTLTTSTIQKAFQSTTLQYWFDNLLLQPAGVPATSAPYGTVTFAGVNGVARTPVQILAQTTTSGGARRLLLSRSPNPPPNFNPVISGPVSGTPTTSTAYLAGHYYAVPGGGGITYRIPASSVSGSYSLLARLGAVSTTALTTVVTVTVGITGSTQTYTTAAQTITIPGSDTVLTSIGALTLPPQAVDANNLTATIDITIKASNSPRLDDALFLCDRAGETILIDQPSGTHNQFFWLDAPMTAVDTGAVYVGNSSDRSDALSVSAYTTGPTVMQFDPGVNQLLIVVDNASSSLLAQVNATYYERWMSERPS